MRAMRHVPVDREAPAAAYLTARRLLAEGEAVGIFPEAGIGRAYDVRALMPGAVALAAATGAPLVPVAIWGPQRIASARRPTDLTRGRPVSIQVGEPVAVPPGTDPVSGTDRPRGHAPGNAGRTAALPRHQPRAGEDAPWHPARLGGSAPTRGEAAPRESVPRPAVQWRERVAFGPGGDRPVGSEIQPLQLPG